MDNSVVEIIINKLDGYHKEAVCELDFGSVYELLVAVILSAQCTDKRVNIVTKDLFAVANTPVEMLKLGSERLEKIILPCGFYRNKAKNILGASEKILSDYGGEVPSTLEELIKLPGVGRKTANVVYAVGFGGDAIAVDTHVFRVSRRIGFSKGVTPLEVEEDLMRIIPKDKWSKTHHLLIHQGRYVCSSRMPKCDVCPIADECSSRNSK